jgi:hypothetical protein
MMLNLNRTKKKKKSQVFIMQIVQGLVADVVDPGRPKIVQGQWLVQMWIQTD